MNKTNLFLDTGIFLAFLTAMEPRFSGVPIHEWLSLALAATVVVHLLLHWKWIVGVGARFFQKLWHTSRLKFVIDVLLFVDFIGIMLSGILISRAVLPALGIQLAQTNMQWRSLHTLTANAGILLVGLHFALSWAWIVSTVKRQIFLPLLQPIRPNQVVQPVPVRMSESNQTRGEKSHA
jgi:hypothetical protein